MNLQCNDTTKFALLWSCLLQIKRGCCWQKSNSNKHSGQLWWGSTSAPLSSVLVQRKKSNVEEEYYVIILPAEAGADYGHDISLQHKLQQLLDDTAIFLHESCKSRFCQSSSDASQSQTLLEKRTRSVEFCTKTIWGWRRVIIIWLWFCAVWCQCGMLSSRISGLWT